MVFDFLYVHLNLVFFSSILISQCLAFTHPSEVWALQDLYRALNYPSVLQGWNGSDPCEEYWTGVVCSGASVEHLKIQGLNLTGCFGSMLYNLHKLKELDVSSNNIMGEIPFSLPPNATHMNLSHNFLNGPIGDVFTGLDNLKEMDLSYNNFSGDLPSSFGSLTNLARLFLHNNRFTGSVAYLAELPLIDLNIQDNLFSGILPQRFQSIPNLWIGGNKFYTADYSPPWTFPLDTVPVEHNISRPPTTQANAIKNYAPPKVSEYKKKHIGPGGIAFMVGGGTIMATGVALVVAIRLNKLRAQSPNLKSSESNHCSLHSHPTSATIEVSSTAIDDSPQIPSFNAASLLSPMLWPSLQHNNAEEASRRSFSIGGKSTGRTKIYTVAELQLATSCFNEGNLLGEGSLGPVYRAGFPDGKILAVKNINMAGQSFRKEEKFLDVICTASRLKHPNIVALNGYCLERGNHLLVYDYVRNLTLNDALHSETYKPLSWIHRLQIAVGVAQALDYLHSACPPVAHGNLKAANVLLDENLMPRVSDCGLAILRPLRSNQVKIPATEIILGERGYAAPDHGQPGTSSRKRDVYAFGVLLLEMLTGRKPFDGSKPREEQYLAKWASSRLQDSASLEQMVDPNMKRTFSSKALSRYAKIISLCIQPVRQFRPPMSEVVESLVSFSQKFNTAKSRVADGSELDPLERSFRSTNTRFIGSPALSRHVSP
ncbi:protein STRUBBELIG-RECEPTOR FAMILY 2-like [Gastrolobium bilobum]|uniref:protein STRUBBELIG-RECEPTOR FAMILY 2-like n=1 Tax=Gastrolobium bilobum TaxID=150636 RepID=UPI002AB2D6D7|nr:protein STRUBBELIG-RECEPTOR FAMILY 2-like [Gastrolobium bilobum]